MKKDKENQPIDDLFARKLSNLSLPPSADGFERLQARMNQRDQKIKVVMWHNPVMQRYMAAAACLLLVCLFGWLYWPNADKNGSQVAVNQTHRLPKPENNSIEKEAKETVAKAERNNEVKNIPAMPSDKAVAETITIHSTEANVARIALKPQNSRGSVQRVDEVDVKPTLAQIRPVEKEKNLGQPATGNVVTALTTDRLAENNSKASTPTERVLVVTIEEPAALVAARQSKNSVDERVAQSVDEKDVKEMKGNGIWQQVKRLKQGELFARSDNATNDDQGLLSRAYTGLKQSFDKGKSTKQ